LPFGNTTLALDLVLAVFILLHQFLSGKLFIQYDRLLWFLGVELAITCSLLLNFNSTMLNSFFLFMVTQSLATLSRPSTSDRYNSTLHAFQLLVLLLSYLAVAQFVVQFVVDGRKLILFYGIVPDFLLSTYYHGGLATINTIPGSSLIRSNGVFLGEASIFSQVAALGILIEAVEFRRPLYLLVMALGLLLAYSGTGLMVLLLFLPIAGLRYGRAGLSALLVVMFALGLFATEIIDLNVFLFRSGEFQTTNSSGSQRFVTPLWLAAKHFDTGSLQALLVGNGPGTVKNFYDLWWGGSPNTLLKTLYEYGIIGSFTYVWFFASCLRRSRCPGIVLGALIFIFVFEQGYLVTWFWTMIIVLCTLHGPEPRRGRINEAGRYEPSLVAGSASG
jgi:hypothetical protein